MSVVSLTVGEKIKEKIKNNNEYELKLRCSMDNINILKIYTSKKTDTRNVLKSIYNNNLDKVIKDIQNSPKPEDYNFRTKRDYPMQRQSYKEVISRSFETEKYRKFSPEHAQKFYLYTYGVKHKLPISKFGYMITYELPFFENRNSGAVDLVAYDKENNTINLIELKNCEMGNKNASSESLIRAILEIETYTRFVNIIIDHEKGEGQILKERLRRTLKKLYGIDITKEVFYEAKIQKNLLIPKSLLTSSMSNKNESDILKNIPKDINIYFLKFNNKNFDTSQSIEECANKNELEIEIYE